MLDLSLDELVNCSGTADWRRRKYEQYPEDVRNLRASELLSALSSDLSTLNNSEAHKRLAMLYYRKADASDIISEHLRSVGFHNSPSAVELLEGISDSLEMADDFSEDDC